MVLKAIISCHGGVALVFIFLPSPEPIYKFNPTWPGGRGQKLPPPPVDFFPGAGKLFDCGKKIFLTFSEIILEGKIQKTPPKKIFPAATAAPKKTQNL